ncbi:MULTISPECIES: carbon storage regulator [Lysobacter]|jgi:carbon storage regulator|uniref:carbon storage regulator n=1 Tax=Lysobacter TaxID=68 RepID=UPI001F169F38|nr:MULTISPECIES: carbon storage regulator [Lysobacter]UJB19306.1 carbon storage regulator [Lysobacter capsici]UJQ26969.1 carbon storage regulator [Lysobacter gummosus]
MLVLTRNLGQALMIGSEIEVRFLKPRVEGEVRVGITAPDNVRIVREELLSQGNERHGKQRHRDGNGRV